MSDLITINGFLFRKAESESILILRDEDFDIVHLKESVIHYMVNSGVKALELNESFFEGTMDFEFLKQVPWVESIVILKSNGVNYQSLKYLAGLKKIVNNYTSEPIDFSVFKKLVVANILWTEDSASLFVCDNLEVLVLHKYKGKKLQKFHNFKKLYHLELINSSIDSLDGIEHLEKLEVIELSYNSKLFDLSMLSKCKKLKKIKLDSLSKIENLFFLEKCGALESLSIHNCKRVKDNTSLFKLSELKTLGYLNSGAFATIKGIVFLQKLERFVFYDTNIADGDLEPILNLRKLNYCYFKDKKHYNLVYKDFAHIT